MHQLTPGQIYLADRRGFYEDASVQSNYMFNYNGYFADNREPFGPLTVFNDEVLAAKKSIVITVGCNGYALLIPVTGAVDADVAGECFTLDVGQMHVLQLNEGDVISLTNPYDDYQINYLFLQFKCEPTQAYKRQFNFDFAGKPNQLLPVIKRSELPFSVQIGHFEGRKESLYEKTGNESMLYCFLIAGAFEVQGRLLHERDGLALWNTNDADMEALSNGAVILVIEMPDAN
ncbi:hypothetical protein FPZ43_03995 [Mucilaginibacter pallidiroseus]|uniref:Quercetin 2,3-dioxygenase C-terminal cupin domain-containing protein n=1 Tax=Mucilaginibacter pallidiroseus TaxID=2599295 RepID=A0A563UJW5_9SPHI|nr:hypothetical protein [Mucilaginibacter pallidiroseus]TWR31641.1 hypothetical protein FPZ43_03995 [Mucilaginibacter pallidiroseus]